LVPGFLFGPPAHSTVLRDEGIDCPQALRLVEQGGVSAICILAAAQSTAQDPAGKKMATCSRTANRHKLKATRTLKGFGATSRRGVRYQQLLAVDLPYCGSRCIIDAAQVLGVMRQIPWIDHLFTQSPRCRIDPIAGRLHAIIRREVKAGKRYDRDRIRGLRRQLFGDRRGHKDDAEPYQYELAEAIVLRAIESFFLDVH
jgi:hypothetical protein